MGVEDDPRVIAAEEDARLQAEAKSRRKSQMAAAQGIIQKTRMRRQSTGLLAPRAGAPSPDTSPSPLREGKPADDAAVRV